LTELLFVGPEEIGETYWLKGIGGRGTDASSGSSGTCATGGGNGSGCRVT
jgi:hypothetical protein